MNLFITGGAGYLGRSLLRVLATKYPDVQCTIFSRDNGKHARCRKEFPQHRYVIGDVRDYNSVELAMAGHDMVVHAAAFKYVPESETNVAECHEINVLGSLNVARAAIRNGVKKVIGLSTDKACHPINVYGMSKSLMERIFQDMDSKSDTRFNLVRYGNVVSSTGSAIPIFRRQAREEKAIKLTNPDMTRFWLTVYEAVDLILQAFVESERATILIPRCSSLNMMAVVNAALMIEFGSLSNAADVKIDITGQRFGEKVHESLWSEYEAPYIKRVNDKLMRLYPLTSKPLGIIQEGYDSGHPDHTLTSEEAIKMIAEAPE